MTNYQKVDMWGKEFRVSVIFDCYEGETITNAQKVAFANFLAHPEWVDLSKKSVVDYCSSIDKENKLYINESDILDDIEPKELFIKRDDVDARVALLCECRCEPEHGLAIVFSHDGNVKVGIQDIIL